MRILLDECLPKDLAGELPSHHVKTVPQAGWTSISNGKLLRLIAESGKFDVFLTMDKRLPQQNKIRELPFAVVVLRAKSNRLEDILPFAHLLLHRLGEFKPGHAYVLTQAV
jgi:predicted nuclease of predicted toxin-antitoxin system